MYYILKEEWPIKCFAVIPAETGHFCRVWGIPLSQTGTPYCGLRLFPGHISRRYFAIQDECCPLFCSHGRQSP